MWRFAFMAYPVNEGAGGMSVGYLRGLRHRLSPAIIRLMLTASDAAEESQFESARVLAALLSVSAALSGESAFAVAS
jgi:hypothetical protein